MEEDGPLHRGHPSLPLPEKTKKPGASTLATDRYREEPSLSVSLTLSRQPPHNTQDRNPDPHQHIAHTLLHDTADRPLWLTADHTSFCPCSCQKAHQRADIG